MGKKDKIVKKESQTCENKEENNEKSDKLVKRNDKKWQTSVKKLWTSENKK